MELMRHNVFFTGNTIAFAGILSFEFPNDCSEYKSDGFEGTLDTLKDVFIDRRRQRTGATGERATRSGHVDSALGFDIPQ
jgi:hypothetical protein